LLGKVHYGGQTVIIERSGKPVIAMISSETYERLIAEREMRFQVLEHIRSRLPDVPLNEVEQDVAEALAAVRTHVAGRP
jgi:PHD/YefM family antitoxin component YafN of YafNO toxin-antitoxin module